MALKIENRFKKRIYYFNIERNIRKLIQVIPSKDLIGLEKIVIVDTLPGKMAKIAAGVYNRKTAQNPASIVIPFRSVFQGMPSIFFLFPFVAKFTLASVLYHEVGHHYHHTYEHGINKRVKEEFANSYKKRMLNKRFWCWGIFLRPFAPLARYLAKKA